MISVGIDAAKNKNTICILKETSEVIKSLYDIKHTKQDLEDLVNELKKLAKNDELRVVMEATGIYHWPVLIYLKNNGFFVSVINPLRMKLFSKNVNFRNVKTDEIDAVIIAIYGTEKWLSLKDFNFDENKRAKERFIDKFNTWAKKKNHKFYSSTPTKIYELATSMIPTVPYDEVSKLLLVSAIKALRSVDEGINNILSRMNKIATSLPEYKTVLDMSKVGEVLAPLLIAEVGDIRELKDKKSLVCMTGIDVPPYISGQFVANRRVITKKGNKYLRRNLYLVMNSLFITKPKTDTVAYDFMCKKKAEHKKNKQVRVAGMRKFLHIYYARVKEVYIELGLWDKQIS